MQSSFEEWGGFKVASPESSKPAQQLESTAASNVLSSYRGMSKVVSLAPEESSLDISVAKGRTKVCNGHWHE